MIKVKIHNLNYDPQTNQFTVILMDEITKKVLPIWIGPFEGNAIGMAIEHTYTPRPMTHDLILRIIEKLQTEIKYILINDLKLNTYYSLIFFEWNHTEVSVDSRPSDAIALAVRTNAPIYISEALQDKMMDEVDELFNSLSPDETIH